MSVEVYCRYQHGGQQRDINGGLEWWIDGYSGLVAPPVGTGPDANKQHPTLLQSVI